jgi:hypothetical protein
MYLYPCSREEREREMKRNSFKEQTSDSFICRVECKDMQERRERKRERE